MMYHISGECQMLFKLVGKNRWAIWSCCFGSTNCHPCSLVSGMLHLKIVCFFRRFLPRLSLNSWSQVHFKARVFFWAHFWLPFFIQNNFKYPSDFDQLIWIAFEIAPLYWYDGQTWIKPRKEVFLRHPVLLLFSWPMGKWKFGLPDLFGQ